MREKKSKKPFSYAYKNKTFPKEQRKLTWKQATPKEIPATTPISDSIIVMTFMKQP